MWAGEGERRKLEEMKATPGFILYDADVLYWW